MCCITGETILEERVSQVKLTWKGMLQLPGSKRLTQGCSLHKAVSLCVYPIPSLVIPLLGPQEWMTTYVKGEAVPVLK
jgi:hypothetical protein